MDAQDPLSGLPAVNPSAKTGDEGVEGQRVQAANSSPFTTPLSPEASEFKPGSTFMGSHKRTVTNPSPMDPSAHFDDASLVHGGVDPFTTNYEDYAASQQFLYQHKPSENSNSGSVSHARNSNADQGYSAYKRARSSDQSFYPMYPSSDYPFPTSDHQNPTPYPALAGIPGCRSGDSGMMMRSNMSAPDTEAHLTAPVTASTTTRSASAWQNSDTGASSEILLGKIAELEATCKQRPKSYKEKLRQLNTHINDPTEPETSNDAFNINDSQRTELLTSTKTQYGTKPVHHSVPKDLLEKVEALKIKADARPKTLRGPASQQKLYGPNSGTGSETRNELEGPLSPYDLLKKVEHMAAHEVESDEAHAAEAAQLAATRSQTPEPNISQPNSGKSSEAEMPNLRRFPVPAPSLTARRFASSENRRAAQWSSTVPGYTTIGAPPLKKGMRLSSLPPHPSKLGPSTLPNDHRADKSGLVPSMAPTTDRPSQSRDNSTDWEFSSDVRNYLKAHPEVVEGSRPPALTSSSRVAFKRATTKEKMDGIFGWNWKSCAGPEGPDQYSHWVPITAASPTAGVSDRRQLVPHSGTPTSVSAGHKESPVAIVADFFDKNRDTVEGSSVVPTHGPDTPSLNAWAPSPLGGRRSNLSPSPTNNRSDIHNISSRMPQRSSPPNPACNPYYNGPLGGHRADSLRSIDRRYTANPLGSDASLKKFNQEPEPPSPARNPNYRGPPEGYSKDYLLSFKNIYTEKLPGWDEMLKELHNEAPSGLNVPEVVVSGPSPQISHAVPVESPPSPAINSLHSVTFRGPFYGHHGASFSDPFIDRHSQTPPSRYPQTVPCPSGAPYSPAALYPPYSRPTRPSRLPLFMDNEYLTHLAIHNTRPGRPDRPTPPLHTSSNTPPSPSPLNNPTFFEHVAAASLGTGCDVDQPFPRLALPVAHRFLARPPHRGVPPQVQMMLESRIPARDAWIRRKATEIATAGRECRAAETVYQNSGSLEDYQIWQERKRRVVEMTDLEGILVERRALFMSQDWRVMRDSRGNVLRGFEAVFERTIAQQHMQA